MQSRIFEGVAEHCERPQWAHNGHSNPSYQGLRMTAKRALPEGAFCVLSSGKGLRVLVFGNCRVFAPFPMRGRGGGFVRVGGCV